jgi:formylglycine-generating enzyme required for sulfatase activity
MNDVATKENSMAEDRQPPDEGMAWIPGGAFLMGSDVH